VTPAVAIQIGSKPIRLGVAGRAVEHPDEMLHHLGIRVQRGVRIVVLGPPTPKHQSLGSEHRGRHRHMMHHAPVSSGR
jgi:hypothetical protein